MARIAYYREWRPQNFDQVVAQEQIVFPLRQSVIQSSIQHAYLFTGTRGTGKTSLARIYAKAVNCLQPDEGNPCNQCEICLGINEGNLLDVVEMDAASHNSVENIRRITDEVLFAPVAARYKVYIIDEAHMLSGGAFNALLKTLEEPPDHAIFILATTEPHRIPATIISRCQRYDFRRIPVEDVVARLRLIADSHEIKIDDLALQTMANLAEGTLRDAISLLDQASIGIEGEITRDLVLDLVGLVDDDFLAGLARALVIKDIDNLLDLINQLSGSGRDLVQTVVDLSRYLRNVLVVKISADPAAMIQATDASLQNMKEIAKLGSKEYLIDLIQGLASLLQHLRWTPDIRTSMEIGLIRLMGKIEILGKIETAAKDKVKEEQETAGAKKTKEQKIAKTTEAIAPDSLAEEILPAAQDIKDETSPSEEISLAELVPPPEDFFFAEKTAAKETAHKEDGTKAEESTLEKIPEETPEEIPEDISKDDSFDRESKEDIKEVIIEDKKSEDIGNIEDRDLEDIKDIKDADAEAIASEDISPKEDIAAADAAEADLSLADHEQLLDHWQNILNKLNEMSQIDILIMARSSKVSFDGENWYLDFDSSMNSQYERCSMPDAIRLLSRLASEEMKRPVVVITRQKDDSDAQAATAEPAWLSRVRKVCQETDTPLEVEE